MFVKAFHAYLALFITAAAAMRIDPAPRIAHTAIHDTAIPAKTPAHHSYTKPVYDKPAHADKQFPPHNPDAPWLNYPCRDNTTIAAWAMCDTTLDVNLRVADILKRLTLSEKIGALGTGTPALPSIGASPYNWWSEATHGISHVNNDELTPYQGNYALPITTAASFNRSLWWHTAQHIGKEARAFLNVGNAYSTFWAPVINLVRDPRWGRNLETPGEDPYLTGQYAINFVRGLERNAAEPQHVQASACCKHYVANSLESWNGSERYNFNAEVPLQDLADSYMAPFRDCVEQGRVTGLMCSYNAVNGVPSCANSWMLQTMAREAWGFDGYVTSDCDADQNVFDQHHYTRTPEEAVRDVLRAGTDVDCFSFVPRFAQSALNQGLITEADMDARLANLFRMRMRLGHFDPPGPLSKIGTDVICSKESIEVARDGTRQATVLLKNLNSTLPLSTKSIRNALIVGPTANLSYTIANYYAGSPCGGDYWTVADGLVSHLGRWMVTEMSGVGSVSANDTGGIQHAVENVSYYDLIVLAVGQDLSIEAEGRDRPEIGLSYGQQDMISKVAAAAVQHGKTVVAVILTGGAVDATPLLSNPNVHAVLHAGQPSVTAPAVADVMFGHPVAGKMVQTTYHANFVNEVSLFDMGMRPGPSKWPPFTNPGRTYRFYTGEAVLPFGFGLSYTTWAYKIVDAPPSLDLGPVRGMLGGEAAAKHFHSALMYTVNVTNTGKVDSDDVVLGFMTPPGAGANGVPQKQLFGFERVHVRAGETVSLFIGAQLGAFTQPGTDGAHTAHAGRYRVHFGLKETRQHGMGYAETELLAV